MTTLRIRKIESSKNLITFEEITTGIKAQLLKDNVYQALKNLYYWQNNSNPTSFTAMLYFLLSKADDVNKMKIFAGFPEETICFLLWYTSKNNADFYKQWFWELKNDNEN